MIRLLLRLAAAVLLLWFGLAAPASAERRVALVIGNSNYVLQELKLPNPGRDAEAVADTLTALGFEVTRGIDLSHAATLEAMREFARQLEAAEVALFYFAGHGLQVDGENYFLPIDNVMQDREDLDHALSLTKVQTTLEQSLRINIILIDACRDNPLAERLNAAPVASRSIGRTRGGSGLAAVRTGAGTFIVFATDPGKVAYDGKDGHSPFTGSLLRHLPTPDLELTKLIQRVQYDVLSATDGEQRPWALSSLIGDFYFRPRPGGREAAPPEQAVWRRIADSPEAEPLIAFLRVFPQGQFAEQARVRLQTLAGTARTSSDPTAPPAPSSLDRAAAKLYATMPPVRRLVTGGFTYNDTRMPTACGRDLARMVGAALGGNVVMAALAEEATRSGTMEPDLATTGPLGLPTAVDTWLLEGRYTTSGDEIQLVFTLEGRNGRITSERVGLRPAFDSPCRGMAPPSASPLTSDVRRGALGLELASPRGGSPVYTIASPPERIELWLRVSAPAHLYCFERDSLEQMQMLLPNRFRPDSQVEPGRILLLPTDIRPTDQGKILVWLATEPGTTIIKCFATDRPVLLPSALADVRRAPGRISGVDEDDLLRAFRESAAVQLAEASIVASVLPEEWVYQGSSQNLLETAR